MPTDSDKLGLRDIALMCEMLSGDDPDHRPSTIVTLHGRAKCAQNEVELGAAMTRAAVVERS